MDGDRGVLLAIYGVVLSLAWNYYGDHQGWLQLGGDFAARALGTYGGLGLIVAAATWLWAVRIPDARGVA